MISNKPFELPDKTFPSVFNPLNWTQLDGYVTMLDLLDYANLKINNVFRGFNKFNGSIQVVGFINDVSAEVFSYINYIPNIIMTLTNISYNELNDTTTIENKLICDDVESQTVVTKYVSSTTSNITNINVDRIYTQETKANVIKAKVIQCDQLKTKDNIKMFLHVNYAFTFPLITNVTMSNVYSGVVSNLRITLMPMCIAKFYDANNVIIHQENNVSQDVKYNIDINNIDIDRIEVNVL